MANTKPSGGTGESDRVRFCLACGQVVAYEQRTCPSCGQFDPLPDQAEAATVACPSCGKPKRESLLFCTHCGADVGLPALTAPPATPPPASSGEPLLVVLSLLAPLLALFGIAQAVLGAVRG